MMAPELPRAVCLACGCTGQSVLLSADGKKPFSAALLPRCGCIFRLHKARRLPAISALLASTTLPAEPAGCCTVTVLAEGAPGPDQTPAMLLATRQPVTGVNEEEHAASKSGAGHAQRPVMSAHQLQESLAGGSREIMVYGTAVCEEALLGSLELTSEMTLHDVRRMLHDLLDLNVCTICRATAGSPLCVPIHEVQYHKKALPFFPLPEQHLVVLEAEDPFDEVGEEGSWEEGGWEVGHGSGEEPTGKKLKLAR